MELFKDKSGLKVISVGFLLGMVSYLHGMPASSLSLSLRGDKVVLVYSGDIEQLDASAIDFLSTASFIDHHFFVIDGTQHLVGINHQNTAFGSLINHAPFTDCFLRLSVEPKVQTPVKSVDWHFQIAANTRSIQIAENNTFEQFAVEGWFHPSAFLSSANAVRAGPLA